MSLTHRDGRLLQVELYQTKHVLILGDADKRRRSHYRTNGQRAEAVTKDTRVEEAVRRVRVFEHFLEMGVNGNASRIVVHRLVAWFAGPRQLWQLLPGRIDHATAVQIVYDRLIDDVVRRIYRGPR